jgi:hypothetical protein
MANLLGFGEVFADWGMGVAKCAGDGDGDEVGI